MTFTAIIVDDEELARALIREMLSSHAEVEIVAECANGFEAVKAVSEKKPDLLFLDIQMPKLDGFEVLELLDSGPAVIFVTAYDAYAMRAFEVYAVDYLLKPVSAERFEAALARARQRIGQRTPPPVELASAARRPGQQLERVVVKDGTGCRLCRWQRSITWRRRTTTWLSTARARFISNSRRYRVSRRSSMPPGSFASIALSSSILNELNEWSLLPKTAALRFWRMAPNSRSVRAGMRVYRNCWIVR